MRKYGEARGCSRISEENKTPPQKKPQQTKLNNQSLRTKLKIKVRKKSRGKLRRKTGYDLHSKKLFKL